MIKKRLLAYIKQFHIFCVIISIFIVCGIGCSQKPPATDVLHVDKKGLDSKAGQLSELKLMIPSLYTTIISNCPGTISLNLDDSVTIEDLRGIVLDSNAPALGGEPVYADNMKDGFVSGKAPYIASGIAPFRLQEFNCEFSYGGWHNYDMTDYAATHGFGIIYPYVRKVEEGKHLPAGTEWIYWTGFDWHKWMHARKIPRGRFDQLMDRDVVAELVAEDAFARNTNGPFINTQADVYMIDMEHPVLSPEALRKVGWYPKSGSSEERVAFEKKYYDGYARTFVAPVIVARKAGWKDISIYGWYPYGRTWGGLEQVDADPGTDVAWNSFGKQVFGEVDIVNNSVYCFYWSPQNVAYTLANIDINIRMTGNKKPMRPYYWTLLHGGGGGWRWWRNMPLPNEEQRAMTAMGFFTGFDGFDLWNWSYTKNHHRVKIVNESGVLIKDNRDQMVGKPFSCKTTAGKSAAFVRYDVVHVDSVDTATDMVQFQQIDKSAHKPFGVTPDKPTYVMKRVDFLSHMRPQSESVAGLIEGMALVKPFEKILRNGKVMIDVPAQDQFKNRLPVVRRVKLDGVHVLITYDPNVIHNSVPVGEKAPPAVGESRWITLEDFDGIKGRTLRLPADAETRIFVIEETGEEM